MFRVLPIIRASCAGNAGASTLRKIAAFRSDGAFGDLQFVINRHY
jgi:hypothetical protein